MVRTSAGPLTALRGDRRDGFTIVELVVGVGVLALLLVGLGTCLASSLTAQRETMAFAIADDLGRQTLDRIAFEMRYASNIALDQAVDAEGLSFESVVGWDVSQPGLGPARTLELQGGEILLDGDVIATGVSDLTMNLDGSLLTVVVEIDAAAFGAGTTELRQSSAQLRIVE